MILCSEELSHMLYAAADMVLVPSMYEPCGLAQMIGMRYGAVSTFPFSCRAWNLILPWSINFVEFEKIF